MNILVIQTGKLGDMVCTTPVFRAIKVHNPSVTLYVAGDAINKHVLKGNPHVDTYLIIGELEHCLSETKFDVAILLTPNPNVLWMLLKARIKKIIVPKVTGGFSPLMTKKYRLLSLFVTRVPHRMGHYAPQEYLNMLIPLGIVSTDTTKELWVEEQVEKMMEALLKPYGDNLKIAIAPGAGNQIKEWPPENFNAVARDVQRTHKALVVLIGGEKDKHLAEIVKKDLDQSLLLDTVGKINMEELKSLIKHLDIFISADTGPIYIAEAFGIKTVDIIGPIDEREQPPKGERHISVIPPGREKPELYVMNARIYNQEKAQQLARATTVDAVLEALQDILSVHD